MCNGFLVLWMMQTLLTKYWLAVHVALLLFASWIGLSSPRGSTLVFLLWLSLLALEALALLPTVRTGENLADARQRVLRSLAQDPFFYLGLSMVGFVCAQWLNSGCPLVYLTDADVWQRSLPPLAWAPFSVEGKDAQACVSGFAACFVGGLVLRNSVGKAGKRYLLQAASAVSGCVACLMVWQACQGIEPYAGMAANPGACAMGSFFGFWLVLGMGGYVEALARKQRGSEMLFVTGFLFNLAGMLFFAAPLSLVLYGSAALLLFVYWMAYLRQAVPKAVQLKLFFVMLVVVAAVVLSVSYIFPDNPVIAKLKVLADIGPYWTGLSETREVRTDAALNIWKEHVWVGVGANGFFHFVGTVVEGKAWALIKNDQALVHNDCLQYLCEYGVLGTSLLGAGVVTLLVPVCYRARLAWQEGASGTGDGRSYLLRLSPFVLTGVCGTALCFAESWMGNPFRSFGLLTSWVFVMATLPSFLPARNRTAT